jgi:transcriptional regulator with XRE-family HTH domain
MRSMDCIRFGLAIRALRRRRGWRQQDLAGRAGLSRAAVWRIESGQADRLTVRALEAIASTAGGRLDIRLTWNGEALDRLLDSAHAALVEATIARSVAWGWDVTPEVSFNVLGERGSIDILAFHRPSGCLLVIEVKSVVPDVQAMLAALDRRARVGRHVAADRGWKAASVSRLLVIGGDRTARRRVAAFDATFSRALPVRGPAVDRWLRSPDASAPMAGLRFVSGARQASARHRVGGARDRVDPLAWPESSPDARETSG